MFGLLLLLFIVVPILELFVIVQVADGLGVLPTIALLLTVSLLGAWLVRREGTNITPRIREALFGGRMPSKEIADGALIMLGGAFLLTPGFVTDAIGLSLMIPPIRALYRNVVLRRFDDRKVVAADAMRTNVTNRVRSRVIDVEEVNLRRTDGTPGIDGTPRIDSP